MAFDLFKPKVPSTAYDGPFIEMSQIVKTFKTPAGEFPALRGIDASFKRGEFVSVVGKSGSGKSTLVNMLTGIDHPTSGQVRIGDTYVHRLNESQMARWRGRNLGLVFQFYQLLPMLSLLENVLLPMDLSETINPAQREKRAMELLDMVGLADQANKMPSSVSGGQQQSAAIARALANDPPLIVADEPTGNLDSKAADKVFHIFETLALQGKTIIMVTHDSSLAARAMRTMLLSDGELVHETVVNAMPMLTHQQMLKATKSLIHRRYEPGELVIRQGERNDAFFMIANGQAEVTLGEPDRTEKRVALLGPGQYFGEVTLLRQGSAIASVRASAHGTLDVVSLERTVFDELLDESHSTRAEIARVMGLRMADNAARN